ncbi:MAG: S9 family peptidase [Armatimonadota bacterium]|nr:S9 family peptidase [Armatimonadota bacterium]MDR7534128.1 S9 family peptidase [Armatimonadota bacterium]MDR7535838.1 S9 family peptidase [Armatimonadota bacterium]
MARRLITADDLLRIRFPHDPALAPDGRRAAFALAWLDAERNDVRARLWVVDTAGGRPEPFTAEGARDARPVWSPDGRWIAFLSTRSGAQRGRRQPALQLWVLPANGGEARQLTFFAAGVSDPAWSPDSQTLAFVTRGERDALEPDGDPEPPVVREVRRVKYRADGQGYLDGFGHVWIVPVAGGEPVRLTEGDFDHEMPAWLPGGREVVCVANRTPEADLSFARDLWAVGVQTRAMRQLTRHPGPCLSPAPSPDGRWIAFVGHDFHAKTATNLGVWVVPADGGDATNLTAGFDRSVGISVGTDVRLVPPVPRLAWTPSGDAILFVATDRGHAHLYAVGLHDRTVRPLTEGPEVVADFAAAAGVVVYQRILPGSLDELWILPAGGASRPLASFHDDLLAELDLTLPRPFTYAGADGWPMEGWYLLPPFFDPARTYPAVLRIHGGPHSTYGDLFTHFHHLLAAQGYIVVWTNPRGSGGYGEAFTRAVVGDWGGKDSRDILLGLDHVMAQGHVDPARVAVTGASYGGYMTGWVIGHTQRFRCAVIEVCVSNLYSFYGTSDIGCTWGEAELGTTPWDDPERLLMQSPIAYARNVTTPVLFTVNEDDYRCPAEQTEQFYTALRRWGREAVLLRFCDSSHQMSSSGRPRQRLERLRRVLDWLARHLEPAPRDGGAAGVDRSRAL